MAEAAVAAALLLEHVPQAVSVLLRPGALNSLVDAALEEVASPGSDATLGVDPYPVALSVSSAVTCGTLLAACRGLQCTLLQSPTPVAIRHSLREPTQMNGATGRKTSHIHILRRTPASTSYWLRKVMCHMYVGSEACNALSSAVRWLPHDIPLSRQNTGTEEHLRQPGKRQDEPLPDGSSAVLESQDQPSSEKVKKSCHSARLYKLKGPSQSWPLNFWHLLLAACRVPLPYIRAFSSRQASWQSDSCDTQESMERSQTGQLDSIAEQEVPHSNGDLRAPGACAGEWPQRCRAQDSKQYETLTFPCRRYSLCYPHVCQCLSLKHFTI